MLRPSVAALAAGLWLLGACGNDIRNKEKVEAAIMTRLNTRTGLDLNQLDVTTTSVRFDNDRAYATVAIRPKGETNVSKGMSMNYTLEARDGRWVVIEPTRSPGSGNLPPGHPGMGSGDMSNPHGSAPSGGGAAERAQ